MSNFGDFFQVNHTMQPNQLKSHAESLQDAQHISLKVYQN